MALPKWDRGIEHYFSCAVVQLDDGRYIVTTPGDVFKKGELMKKGTTLYWNVRARNTPWPFTRRRGDCGFDRDLPERDGRYADRPHIYVEADPSTLVDPSTFVEYSAPIALNKFVGDIEVLLNLLFQEQGHLSLRVLEGELQARHYRTEVSDGKVPVTSVEAPEPVPVESLKPVVKSEGVYAVR